MEIFDLSGDPWTVWFLLSRVVVPSGLTISA